MSGERPRIAPVGLGRIAALGAGTIWLAVGLPVHADTRDAVISHETDSETGLESWHWRDRTFSLELVQRLPDQTRAFFLGRGFGASSAEAIAQACVFQTIGRNTASAGSARAAAVDLSDWRVDAGDGPRPVRLKRDWQERWEDAGESQAARIAFQWSLFPTVQEFLPGDYNWGMITFGPPPGARFDLAFTWREDGEVRRGAISEIRCAADRTAPPGAAIQ